MDKEEYTKRKNFSNNPNFHRNLKGERTIEKYSSFSSDYLSDIIKNISRPKFLGSIHLKNDTNIYNRSVENLLKGELEGKLTKSLKNAFLNPITKTLIILALVFNIIWFFLIYIF